MKCFTFRQNRLIKRNTNQPFLQTLPELKYVNKVTPYQVYEYNRKKSLQKIAKMQKESEKQFILNICNHNNNAKTVRKSRNYNSPMKKANTVIKKNVNIKCSNYIMSDKIYKVKNYLRLTIHKCVKSNGLKGKEHSYICSSAQTDTSFPYIKSI